MNCVAPQVIFPHRSIDWCDQNEEFPVSVPCGKCIPCLVNKRQDWSFRLEQEHKASRGALFVTLTYDEKHVPLDGSLCKRHLQKYLKRLRKLDQKTNGTTRIRYYAVGEYGGRTGRPHYHLLLFNVQEPIVRSCWKDREGRPIGIVHIGNVTSASVQYVTKYVVQRDDYPAGLEKPFAVMSRAYGIGAHYLTDEMVHWHRIADRNYIIKYGQYLRLPRFYREKIWHRPVDRERISTAAMSLSLRNRERELQYFREQYGDRAELVMAEFRNAVIARVKQKVAFTQTF